MKAVFQIILIGVLAMPKASAQGADAGPPSAQPAMIDGSVRYTPSSVDGTHDYLIDVARVDSTIAPLPDGYRMPVIYVLDGNSSFPLATYLANSIVTFSRQLPSVLVVSIGYPNDPQLSRQKNIENRLTWRNRDFTPKLVIGNKRPTNLTEFGGAAEFLTFIDDDMKPFIATRYQVDTKD